MFFRNHKVSDDDEEYDEEEDEKEYWYDEGKLDSEHGAVGGEWVDSDDLTRIIAVDNERIAAGGFYTNFVDEH